MPPPGSGERLRASCSTFNPWPRTSGTNPPGPTRLHAYASLVGGTGVYAFHEDSTAPDAGGSAGNYTYSTTPVSRIDGQYLDPTQPLFKFYAYNAYDTRSARSRPSRICAAWSRSASR